MSVPANSTGGLTTIQSAVNDAFFLADFVKNCGSTKEIFVDSLETVCAYALDVRWLLFRAFDVICKADYLPKQSLRSVILCTKKPIFVVIIIFLYGPCLKTDNR